jgi:hypothetical protein
MNKTKQVILLVSIIIIAFIIYGRSYAYVYGQGQTDNTSRYIDNDTLKTFQNLDKVFQNLDNGTKWEISQCVHKNMPNITINIFGDVDARFKSWFQQIAKTGTYCIETYTK